VGEKDRVSVWEVGGAGRPANSTPPPVFRPFPPEKLFIIEFWVRGLTNLTCKGEDGEVKPQCKQGWQFRVGSLARGTSDDDNDRIYSSVQMFGTVRECSRLVLASMAHKNKGGDLISMPDSSPKIRWCLYVQWTPIFARGIYNSLYCICI